MSKNTQKTRVYRNWQEQWDDEFSEWFWTFTAEHVIKCLAAFVVVSSPVFLIGAAVAPTGVNRLEHGAELVGKQHEFLWGYLGGGIKNTLNVTGSVLGPIINNGASDNGDQ